MRRICWIVILFQFAWLNVIVPGHVRGAITMPAGPRAASCCAPHSPKSRNEQPTPEQQKQCAVCYVAAGYTLPPVFHFDPQPGGLTFNRIVPFAQHTCLPSIPRTYDAHAPPRA